MKKQREGSLVYFGAEQRGVVAASKAIMDILKSGQTEAAQVEALKCLSSLCHVGPISITNSHFNAS